MNDNVRAPSGHSFIYVIQFGEYDVVKVGIGEFPNGRLKALQTGSFCKLRIAHLVGPLPRHAAFAVEQVVHDIMACRGLVGEWFSVPVDTAANFVSNFAEYYIDLMNSGCPEEFEGGPAKEDFEMECWMNDRRAANG